MFDSDPDWTISDAERYSRRPRKTYLMTMSAGTKVAGSAAGGDLRSGRASAPLPPF